MRAHALLLLVAGTGLARGGGSSDGGSTPSDAAVYDAAWTFVLSAAAHAADTESDPDKFCRTAMVTLARWLPGEADRERMLAIFKSSVVHERLKFMPTMDDCSILLWYAHEAGALARGGKVSPSGLAPDATFAADAGAQAAAAALWVSPVRERVLAVIDRVWLGHAAEHPAVVSARPQLDLFVMSACPYGILAENELLGSALPMLGDTFDLQIHFITFSRFAGANGTAVPSGYCASPKALGGKGAPPLGPTDDAPCSMHGSDEADEDARQMAVEELYSPAKLNAYILAFNKLGCTLDKYRDCSAKVSKYKSVGVDFAKISSHAAKSLSAYAASTQKAAAEVGYKAIRSTELSSPTLVVNGHVAALGALDAAGFVSRVCAFYAPGSLPEACAPDKQKEIRAGGKADRAEAPAAPAGASCLRADALPAAVPTPRLALAHAAGAGPSAALLPAAAGLLATAAAVFALVAVSLKRMRRYGHVGAPALAAAHGRQTVSTPLV